MKLDDIRMDKLREAGNIGAGKAATALAALVGREVRVTVPTLRVLGRDALPTVLAEKGDRTAALVRVRGEMQGYCLFLVECGIVTATLRHMLGADRSADPAFFRSVVDELANIVSGSYLTAIATRTGLTYALDVPRHDDGLLDRLERGEPASVFTESVPRWVLIETDLYIVDLERARGTLCFLPGEGALEKALGRLGRA